MTGNMLAPLINFLAINTPNTVTIVVDMPILTADTKNGIPSTMYISYPIIVPHIIE